MYPVWPNVLFSLQSLICYNWQRVFVEAETHFYLVIYFRLSCGAVTRGNSATRWKLLELWLRCGQKIRDCFIYAGKRLRSTSKTSQKYTKRKIMRKNNHSTVSTKLLSSLFLLASIDGCVVTSAKKDQYKQMTDVFIQHIYVQSRLFHTQNTKKNEGKKYIVFLSHVKTL